MGKYSYFLGDCSICNNKCRILNTGWLFKILSDNTFNAKSLDAEKCNSRGNNIYHGDSSYITYVKWDDFYKNEETFISKAYDIREKKEQFTIRTQL